MEGRGLHSERDLHDSAEFTGLQHYLRDADADVSRDGRVRLNGWIPGHVSGGCGGWPDDRIWDGLLLSALFLLSAVWVSDLSALSDHLRGGRGLQPCHRRLRSSARGLGTLRRSAGRGLVQTLGGPLWQISLSVWPVWEYDRASNVHPLYGCLWGNPAGFECL